jgi:hypothetical protein
MNVEIRTETPIFFFWEYLFRNFGILSLQCTYQANLPRIFILHSFSTPLLAFSLMAQKNYVLAQKKIEKEADWLIRGSDAGQSAVHKLHQTGAGILLHRLCCSTLQLCCKLTYCSVTYWLLPYWTVAEIKPETPSEQLFPVLKALDSALILLLHVSNSDPVPDPELVLDPDPVIDPKRFWSMISLWILIRFWIMIRFWVLIQFWVLIWFWIPIGSGP